MSEEAPKQRSRATRFLMGCSIGCGAVVVLSMVGCISCVVWLNSPGEVIDPESLLAGDTSGYLEWTVDLDDPGTAELVDSSLAWVEEVQQAGVPDDGPGKWIGMFQQWGNRNNEKEIRKLFPVVIAGTLRPVADSDDGFVLTASLRGADHQLVLADWIGSFLLRRSSEAETMRYRGETVLLIPPGGRDDEPFGLFIRHGDVFLTSSADQAEHAIDLLTGHETSAGGTAAVDRWYREAPERPLRGAISNRTGEVRRLWSALDDSSPDEAIPAEVWDAVEGVVLSGGFDASGVFSIDLEFDLTDASHAEIAADQLGTGMERALSESLFHLTDVSAVGDRLRLALATEPLVDKLKEIEIPNR